MKFFSGSCHPRPGLLQLGDCYVRHISPCHPHSSLLTSTSSYDGAALGNKYEPAAYTGPEPEPTHFTDGKVYHGSCHCGAVTAAVKLPTSLEDKSYKEMIMECNCSLCRRVSLFYMASSH